MEESEHLNTNLRKQKPSEARPNLQVQLRAFLSNTYALCLLV